MDADEFYNLAKSPDFPDEMDFLLTAVNPENPGTFSRDGVRGIVSQIDNYMMARIFGRWAKTQRPPKRMKLRVSIEWEDAPDEVIPWYHGETDDIGLSAADGEHRSRIFKDEV